MNVYMIISLVWLHFIADFLLQSDWMAINKSKRADALVWHSMVYSLTFLVLGPIGLYIWVFAFISHVVIDGISSRITSILYKRDKRHWFFVIIGLDQAIHITILILAYQLFTNAAS